MVKLASIVGSIYPDFEMTSVWILCSVHITVDIQHTAIATDFVSPCRSEVGGLIRTLFLEADVAPSIVSRRQQKIQSSTQKKKLSIKSFYIDVLKLDGRKINYLNKQTF